MIAGRYAQEDVVATDAPENNVVGLDIASLTEDAAIPKLSALLDGEGSGSGQQRVRGVIWDAATGEVVAESEEIEIEGAAPLGWYDLWFEDPVPWTRAIDLRIGLHFGEPDAAARYYEHEDSDGFTDTDTYTDGTAALSGPSSAGEPLVFATYATNPDLPIMEDLYYGRLGFPSAQERLGQTGSTGERHHTKAGWHGTFLDSEPQGASFAIVDRDSDLASLVGDRVRVRYGNRSVAVYVHRVTDLDSDDIEISLSRRAFHALSVLSAEKLDVRVEILA